MADNDLFGEEENAALLPLPLPEPTPSSFRRETIPLQPLSAPDIIWTKFQIQQSSTLKLPEFKKDDWETWSKLSLRKFNSAGLQPVVLCALAVPDPTDSKNDSTYLDQCRQAVSKILESLPKEYESIYVNYELPSELWNQLKKDYATKAANLMVDLFSDLVNLKMETNTDVEAHVAKLQSIEARMRTLRGPTVGYQTMNSKNSFLPHSQKAGKPGLMEFQDVTIKTFLSKPSGNQHGNMAALRKPKPFSLRAPSQLLARFQYLLPQDGTQVGCVLRKEVRRSPRHPPEKSPKTGKRRCILPPEK
jgi:hypothetical protein